MQKRYAPIMLVVALTAALAVVGYLMPQNTTENEDPVRILLENVGGAVVFDHKVHVETYGMDCVDCHHEISGITDPEEAEASIIACGSCHGVDYTNPDFISEHLSTFSTDAECATCHHYQFEDSDPDNDFHHDKLVRNMENCLACHNEPTNSEKLANDPDYMLDYAQVSCSSCHDEPASELILGRMDAFHNSCMGCHESIGVGPYTDEQCAQCHI